MYERYRRPLFIAETGIEGDMRPVWLSSVCDEVRRAQAWNVPVLGLCLYLIINHPGWDDDRHCYDGLWDYANDTGERTVYEPLAQEIHHQDELFKTVEIPTR